MSIEPRRGCGFRKVGGTYLVGPLAEDPCHRLPIPLSICPTCKHGIKKTRGWTWVNPVQILKGDCEGVKNAKAGNCVNFIQVMKCQKCPLCNTDDFLNEEAGLLWIGEKFYSTVADYLKEAVELGVSRRIPAVPNDFVLGLHYVFLAHPEALPGGEPPRYEDSQAGIFQLWKPERIERIITQTMSEDTALMDSLIEKGITPVIVPDDDPDHNPEGK